MAYNARKIAPTDFKPGTGVGVSIPFSAPGCFSPTYTNKDATKANLINYFLTSRGERYLNPTFGNRLQNLLFEQLTQDRVREINSIVKRDLQIYFPKVEPVEVTTTGIPDTNTVQFVLKYTIRDTNIEDEVVINIEQ